MGREERRMKVKVSCKNVANLLKCIVNGQCEKGFQWYPDVTKADVSIFELNEAIRVLELQEDIKLEVARE